MFETCVFEMLDRLARISSSLYFDSVSFWPEMLEKNIFYFVTDTQLGLLNI
jgi:hypothetical protein